jgi:hypothetical protein
MTNALLIAKLTEKTHRIENLLSEYFKKVSRVSDLAGAGQLPPDLHFDLIVATDSLEIEPDGDFLSCLRSRFPNVKFLYLADKISPKTEMSLRSGGLIFLGTYDHFSHSAHQILGSLVDSAKRKSS